MTTDPFGEMPVWLPDQLDERIEALLDRMEAELAGPTTAKMPDPSRVRIAKLLLRNSKCDTQRYFEAEKVLLQERAYGPLLASYNYWRRNIGGSLADVGPPYGGEESN